MTGHHSDQCYAIGGGPGHDRCVCFCHGTLPGPTVVEIERAHRLALDPLTVTGPARGYEAGYDEGYAAGELASPRSGVVIALLLVAITAAILGGMVGWAVGMGLR